ncbi:IclR family transcriptional regulator C-terminal domain-containing protein [Streptomyces sp. NPDC056682]|uniref:IclR family transcriptional regulator domain-containing protein n=1 Tax=Streptomyces sp. NPDC056682 TaxID=3345909 RepID=UPI0036A87225
MEPAENWLRRAYVQQHPGAAYRLAVVLLRSGELTDRPDVGSRKLLAAVADAARWGHSDAQLLLTEPGPCPIESTTQQVPDTSALEDPEFTPEVRAALAITRAPSPTTGAVPGSSAPRSESAVVPAAPSEAALPPAVPVFVPGLSALWSPAPLRPAPLRSMAQQIPHDPHAPDQWESALRVLDVLDTISSAGRPISTESISQATSLPHPVLAQLLVWLCEQGLTCALDDGGYIPGPVLRMMSQPGGLRPEHVLQQALSGLRDAAGAAVYVSSYTDGEVTISQYADGPATPKVHEWVDFRAAAHASAVGKSLLAQLDFDSRMDHLSRRQPVRLTPRTITDHHALFRALDGHGPQAAQFDLLEYSTHEVCVAVPLAIAGQAGCVALSLPAAQQHRLIDAARTLTNRSAGLLLSLLLASSSPANDTMERRGTALPDAIRAHPAPPPKPPAPAGGGLQPGRCAVPPNLLPALSLPLLGLHLPPTISTPVPRLLHLVSSSC